MDLYGPLRDVARKYLKSIPHTNGVPTQEEVDELTRTLVEVREVAIRDAAEEVGRGQVQADYVRARILRLLEAR